MSFVRRRRSLAAIWLIGLALGASGWIRVASESPQSTALPAVLEKPALAVPAPQGTGLGLVPAEAAVKAWAQTGRDVFLYGEPSEDATSLGVLSSESYVKVLRAQGDWMQVAYGGERGVAPASIAWAMHLDLEALPHKPRWVKTYEGAKLWASAERDGAAVASLPRWSWLELTGEERAGRFTVRVPGDGRHVAPGRGWIDAAEIVPVLSPDAAELPRGYPANTEASALRIPVPYRTQLDETPWAGANCGPTVLSMGLEYLGRTVSSGQVRRAVLNVQNLWGDDAGVYIWALASAADRYGMRALDLYVDDVRHRWSPEDVRYHLERGRPVILQVAYRALPGRDMALYGGDHYVIVTGLVGDGFLYHDPIDSDGVGYDRFMTTAELARAMSATDRRYAYAGFALTSS
jgi:hypothetical protein